MRPPITPSGSGSCFLRGADGAWDGEARPVVNVADPLDPQDVATKSYVDTATGTQSFRGTWVFSVNLVMANPSDGQVRFNSAALPAVTQIAIARLADNNLDATIIFQTLRAGDRLAVQDQNDAAGWATYDLTAAAAQEGGAWWLLTVTHTASNAGVLVQGNNKVEVRFTHVAGSPALAALEARVAALEQHR